MSKILAYILGCTGEFFLLIILAHKALYGAHRRYVFLYRLIELIVFAKNASESRHGIFRYEEQSDRKHGNNDDEHR